MNQEDLKVNELAHGALHSILSLDGKFTFQIQY